MVLAGAILALSVMLVGIGVARWPERHEPLPIIQLDAGKTPPVSTPTTVPGPGGPEIVPPPTVTGPAPSAPPATSPPAGTPTPAPVRPAPQPNPPADDTDDGGDDADDDEADDG